MKQAVQLGARLRFRARMRSFDAVCELVAAGAGIAVIPEAAAQRCRLSMAIQPIKLREPWAQRKLVVCTHDARTLSKPAQRLFEHLRRAGARLSRLARQSFVFLRPSVRFGGQSIGSEHAAELADQLVDRQILAVHPCGEIDIQHVFIERGRIAADADQQALLRGLGGRACAACRRRADSRGRRPASASC